MLSTGDARADTRAKAAKVTADKAEASCVRLARESPMVDIGQDSAARARFDPKAAERAKPGLGQIQTIVMCLYLLWRRKRSPNKRLGAHCKP